MSPVSDKDQRAAKKHIANAHEHWNDALRQFYPFSEQLQRLADAADEQRKVAMIADLAELSWKPQNVELVLPPLLQPQLRPGNHASWDRFDEARDRLERAFAGDGFAEVAASYGDFAAAARELSRRLQNPVIPRARTSRRAS